MRRVGRRWERRAGFAGIQRIFFLAQKEELLKSIQSEIKECEIFEETRDRLGFTDERKDKVRNIGSTYSCILVVAWLLDGGNLYFGFLLRRW